MAELGMVLEITEMLNDSPEHMRSTAQGEREELGGG